MSAYLDTLKFKLAGAILAAALVDARRRRDAAQKPSSQAILDALTPKKPLTRSLSVSPAEQAKRPDQEKFVDTLRNRPTRSLSSNEREQIATIARGQAADRPRDQVRVQLGARFRASAMPDMDSARQGAVRPVAEGQLNRAGRPHRRGRRRGVQPGPVRAPRRRGQAVPDRQVSAWRRRICVTAGYGKTRLKDKANPPRRREPPRRDRQHGRKVTAPDRRCWASPSREAVACLRRHMSGPPMKCAVAAIGLGRPGLPSAAAPHAGLAQPDEAAGAVVMVVRATTGCFSDMVRVPACGRPAPHGGRERRRRGLQGHRGLGGRRQPGQRRPGAGAVDAASSTGGGRLRRRRRPAARPGPHAT